MEITMAVTAGASIQMILLVVPILVLVGIFTGHQLDLVFSPIEVIVFGGSTFIFMLLSRDGESTWLEGVQLCPVGRWLPYCPLHTRVVVTVASGRHLLQATDYFVYFSPCSPCSPWRASPSNTRSSSLARFSTRASRAEAKSGYLSVQLQAHYG